MASNAVQLALGALAAAAVGVGVVWLIPSREVEEPVVEAAVVTDEPVEVVETEVQAETALSETEETVDVSPPTVGLRIDAEGYATIVGTSNPDQIIDILLDNDVLGRTQTDFGGNYAYVALIEPSTKARILSVIADPDGDAIPSVENPLIRPIEVVVADAEPAEELAIGAVTPETPVEEITEAEMAEEPTDTAIAEVVDEPTVTVSEEIQMAGTDSQTEVDETSNGEDAPADTVEIAEGTEAGETEEAETLAEVTETLEAEVTEKESDQVAEVATEEQPQETETLVEDEVAVADVIEDESASVEETEETSAPETTLVADADGVRVVTADGSSPQALSNVALDSIAYDTTGEVLLRGRAGGEGFVQVYVDNQPITTSRITSDGGWRTDLPEVDTGVYTLRIDEVDEAGTVVSRIETPFKREEPEAVAEVMAEETAQEDFKVAVRTVQPGSTLWAIAREQFGEGIMYVAVYEANKDLIRDPDLIYPGQVFRMPEIDE